MRVALVTPTPSFVPGPPVKLFDGTGFAGSGSSGSAHTFAISTGGRFLMLKKRTAEPSLVVVLNWFEELKRLLPR